MEQFVNLTPEAIDFLSEWRNPSTDFVSAHTSGSTGKPKDIKLLKSDMITSAEATCRFFGIGADSYIHCPLSVNYIAGKMMIVRADVSGATIGFEQPSNTPLSVAPAHDEIALLPVVPSQLDGLLKSKFLSSVKNVIVGGAPLSPDTESVLSEYDDINFYATYGMTETCSHVALRHIGDNDNLYISMPGVTFDTDSRDCLIINSPRYSFRRLVTNDIVELIDSNRFRWVGRADNVINTGGLKVYPEVIEKKLAGIIPDRFYIAGKADERWGTRVVMYVEGALSDDIINELRCKCKKILLSHEMPKEFIVVDRFKETSSGKIIRSTEF